MKEGCVFQLAIISCLLSQAYTACPNCHTPSQKQTYSGTNDHLENPGRGFVDQKVTHSSHFSPLTVSILDGERRRSGLTMIWRTYVLDTFRTSSISSDFLNKIKTDLTNVHTAGMTVVVRFCYTFHKENHAPYGDADEKHILQHIQQLKPIFHQFEGVITSVEAGFIGTWGEWYYTTYFGDPQHRDYKADPDYGYTPQQWQGRKNVLTALLDAVPQSTQVQLRYPGQKIAMFHSKAVSYSDVDKQTKSYVARIAHHNDCFLSSDNDYTYHNPNIERPYLAQESRYLIVGGETCHLTKNDRDHCPTALSEMKTFHWTFLNEGYNKDMYALWVKQGCYEEIHRRLGYRLRLTEAHLPNHAQKGEDICFSIILTNDGFAAPVKEMDVYLVLASKSSGKFYSAVIPNTDVRTYQPSEHHTISASVNIPTSMSSGSYNMYLAIGDKILKHESDYYVLMANGGGVPLFSQGLNDLKNTLTISSTVHSGSSSACTKMAAWTPPKRSRHSRLFKAPSSGYASIIG